MNVASLELCKELYELSGWEQQNQYPCWVDNATKAHAQEGYPKLSNNIGLRGKWTFGKQYGLYVMYPAYDAGFLLRKLPKYIGFSSQSCRLGLFPQGFTDTGSSDWCASYDTYRGEIYLLQASDTPEDALCALAIELFKSGVLKKGIGDA